MEVVVRFRGKIVRGKLIKFLHDSIFVLSDNLVFYIPLSFVEGLSFFFEDFGS